MASFVRPQRRWWPGPRPKAATITPPEIGGVGSPNRILREGIGGSVIVRTGRRIPGVSPVVATNRPIIVIRMAVGDAYGADEGRDGVAGSFNEVAWRTERIERSNCRFVSEYAFQAAEQVDGIVYGGPKWTVSPTYEGMLEEMDAAAARHPGVVYRPTLIDAAYAGLLTDAHEHALVIPALNRDGDCLSDLVLAMFGSIAGAESVLLSLNENLHPVVAMAEAPHGTAPSLEGKNVANPMAMLLAEAALLDQASARFGDPRYRGAGARFVRHTRRGCGRRSNLRPRRATRRRAASSMTSSRVCGPPRSRWVSTTTASFRAYYNRAGEARVVRPWRQRVCQGLTGTVLELGFGAGHNLAFYPPGVEAVIAIEPSDLAWRLAQRRVQRFSRPVTRVGRLGESVPRWRQARATPPSPRSPCALSTTRARYSPK